MEQQVGFCRTSDGVSIAYATVGDGPHVVHAAGWPTHLELEWEAAHTRSFLEALAEGSTLIRYDMRGSGLSDRKVSDFSLEALVRDLEAVASHLELEGFDLVSMGMLGGPVALTYTALHPDRVKRLVMSTPYLRGRQITSAGRQRALIDYVARFGMPTLEFQDDPSLDAKAMRDAQHRQAEASTPQVQAAILRTLFSFDAGDLVERVTVPSLVLHGRADAIPFGQGRELAARLRDARFVPFEGSSSPALAYRDVKVQEIRRFLGLQRRDRATVAPDTYTILFTDMESSTALTQRLGDAKAQELVRAHNAIVREALKAHDGSEIKHTGDGIMASFPSASGALECAVAIQQGVAAQPEMALGVRIGLNAGEPVAEEEDLFGASVQLARRVCDQAEAGQIVVADVVRQLATGKGFLFSDLGDVVPKGFEEPVRLYEVRWREGLESEDS